MGEGRKEIYSKAVVPVGVIGKVGIRRKTHSGAGINEVRVFENRTVGIRRFGNQGKSGAFQPFNSTTPTGERRMAVKSAGFV